MNELGLDVIRKLGVLMITAMLCIAGVTAPTSSAQAVPICIDDLCFDVPVPIDYAWTVHAADFDNNGLTDLYLRGGAHTFADEFIVSQTAALQFQVAIPTPAQRTTARSLPNSGVSVFREELNNDGFLDFYLENVDRVIPGAPDLLILTSFGQGKTPDQVIPIPDGGELDLLIDNIEFTLTNLEQVMALFNGQTCVIWTVLIPHQYWDPYYDTYVIQWIPYSFQECYPNQNHPIFSGDLGVFCGGMSNYLVANGGEAGARAAAEAAARNGQVVLDRTIRPAVERIPGRVISSTVGRGVARRAALRVAIVLVLAPAAPAVVAVVSTAALAWALYDAWEFYQEVSAAAVPRPKRRDALVAQGTVPAESYDPQKDPYRMKQSCLPWDNVQAQTPAPTINDGDSERLRLNLKTAGCECPQGTQAHHMFIKRGGDAYGIRLRACLNRAGINIDWAGNGICLPTSEADPHVEKGRTRIASHQGSGVHRYEYIQGLANECEARTDHLANADDKYIAARRLLDEVRQSLHNWRVLQ